MKKPPISFGVCGLGRIGIQHARFFSREPDRYHPVAFCDIDETRAEAAAKTFHASAYTDFAAFLARPDLDLVIIATPSLDHARNAEQALVAGKSVLLEKPIAVTEADFQLLERLDRAYPGKLFFGHNHRFEPAFENTQAILAEGLLGRVQVIKLSKHHRFSRRSDWQMRLDCGGGQLSVWGPHLLDQALQLLGAPVRGVWSDLRRVLTPGDADDHVQILLTGENDVVAEIEISNSIALPGPYCVIYGDRGTLLYGQEQKEIVLRYLAPDFQWPEASTTSATPVIGKGWAVEEEIPFIEEKRAVTPSISLWDQVEIELARHLYEAIANRVPFPVKNADALEVVRITHRIKEQHRHRFDWL